MKESNKEKKKGGILPFLLIFLIGGGCGILAVQCIPESFYDLPFPQFFLLLISFCLFLFLSFFVHIILHEGGHLVAGHLSGYRFSSFRIGRLMLLRRGGRLHWKRLSIAGTGGQCLMAPPPLSNGRFPVVLYNLGGSLANLLFAAIAGALAYLFRAEEYVAGALWIFAVIGLVQALINGIPMRLGMVDNDGYNAIAIRKNAAARRAFHNQLSVNEAMTEGIRLADMPREYFEVPDDADLKNSMVAANAVFRANRLMDEGKFTEADAFMQDLLSAETGMVDVHRNLLLCDRIFCALYAGRTEEAATILGERSFTAFLKAMKSFPTVIRTEYLAAKRITHDESRATAALALFEKCAKSYPYPTDIAAERRLLTLGVQEKPENSEF